MRRIMLAVLAIAAFSPLTARAQTVAQQAPGPEHQRLGIWVGEWTYEVGTSSGTVEGELVGDGFFLQWRETNTSEAGVTVHILHVFGYDTVEQNYTWHRYFINGNIQFAKGWVSDANWTFLFDEQDGVRARLTATMESSEVMTFAWAQSVKGGPWEVTNQGTMTKVR